MKKGTLKSRIANLIKGDKDADIARERALGMVFVAIIIAIAMWSEWASAEHTDLPRKWPTDTVEVYHNPQGAVVPVDYAERIIRQSMSRWNYAETGVTFAYAGETASEWVPGAIVVRHVDTDEVAGKFRYFSTTFSDRIRVDRAQIWISTVHRVFAGNCWHGVMLHEFGHATGIHEHHPESGNVMHTYSYCNTLLTAEDMVMADGDPCHGELLPNYDVRLPAVWDGEHTVSASLDYREVTDGQLLAVDRAEDVAARCEPLRQEDGAVVLDLWGRDGEYRVWLTSLTDSMFLVDRAIVVE